MNLLTKSQQEALDDELKQLDRVKNAITRYHIEQLKRADFDDELIALRDQLAEARLEDQAPLIEQMMRLSSLRQAQDHEQERGADPMSPYFAHLRLTDTYKGEPRTRDICIGKRAFIDRSQGIQVIDWRNSPISRIYYCYHEGDEYEERFAGEMQTGEVDVRRTVTIANGVLQRLSLQDAVLYKTKDGYQTASLDQSALKGGVGTALRAPQQSRRLGRQTPDQRLPEITALIDPAQFKAITDARSGVCIIRGGAGTGKTTIALHRAAWLHFQDPKRFAPHRILMVTPGEALRRYVSQVLPSLDVKGVKIRTFAQFAKDAVRRLMPELENRPFTDDTPMGARRLKRLPTLLHHLENWIAEGARAYDENFREMGGAELEKAWVSRRNLPILVRVAQTKRFVETPEGNRICGKHLLETRRLLDQIAQEFGSAFEIWAEVLTHKASIKQVLDEADEPYYEWEIDQLISTVSQQADEPTDFSDFTDETLHQGVDGRSLDDGELRGHFDVDDLAILLRIHQLQWGRLRTDDTVIEYEHVIVDEAQDLSPLCLKVLCDVVRPGGPVTLAGDEAQRIVFDSGFERWDELCDAARLKAYILPPLAISYRSTRQVMELARAVLGDVIGTPSRDARDGASVSYMHFAEQGEAVAFLADALKSLRDRERMASVALIARSPETATLYYEGLRHADVPALRRIYDQEFDFTPGIDVTDVYQVKGLEYDYVVILEPTNDEYPDNMESRHLFHVAATRAAHQLWLIGTKAPSKILPRDLVDQAQM